MAVNLNKSLLKREQRDGETMNEEWLFLLLKGRGTLDSSKLFSGPSPTVRGTCGLTLVFETKKTKNRWRYKKGLHTINRVEYLFF